jgi:CRISPR-associated protein Csm3
MLLDKFHNKYIVKGVLVAQTPIHIGAGEEGFDPIQADNAVIRDSSGDPYIPGSSLKGVLRSYMETLLKSSGKDILDKNCNPCFALLLQVPDLLVLSHYVFACFSLFGLYHIQYLKY